MFWRPDGAEDVEWDFQEATDGRRGDRKRFPAPPKLIQKVDKTMAALHPWYHRQLWRGPNGLRLFIIRRDPICVLCQRAPSTVADHVVPFRSFPTEQAQWRAFTDDKNLRGVCAPCHDSEGDKSVASGSGQRRNRIKPAGVEITTDMGIKFVTSSLGSAVLDKAIKTAWEDTPK